MVENETLPATRDEGALEIRADGVPERRFATDSINQPMPASALDRLGQIPPLDERQLAILNAPLDSEEVEIRPDGLIYTSHEYVTRKLNEIFGQFQWTLVEASPLKQEPGTNRYYQKWACYIGGIFAGVTMASREYYPDNRQMDLSDIYEQIMSACITRLGKRWGIAHEMWNRGYAEKWRTKNAVQVIAPIKRRTGTTNEKVWRRKDREPFDGELGTVAEVTEREKARTNSARTAGNAGTGHSPLPETAPTAAPSIRGSEVPSGSTVPSDSNHPVSNTTVRMVTPTPDPTPMRGGLLPQQERAIWARARDAGLVVKDDANGLLTLLERGKYSTIVPVAGKTSAENCAALFKGIAGIKLAALLKQIDASKVAQGENDVERI